MRTATSLRAVPLMRFVCMTFVTISALMRGCHSVNILILHPMFAGSHEMILRSLGEQLIDKGHKVTQIRWLSNKTPPVVDSRVEVLTRRVNASVFPSAYFDSEGVFQIPVDLLWQRSRRMDRIPTDIFSVTHNHCHDLLSDRQLLRQLQQRSFQLAVVDLILNECGLGLAAALKLPTVGFWSFSFVGAESYNTGSMNLPSVATSLLSDLAPEMSFIERLYNTLVTMAHKLLFWRQTSIANQYVQKYHPGLPDVARLVKDVNIIMVSSNFLTSQPVLLPPNVQMVGCLQCRPAKPLTESEERFMLSSGEHGVVVFSLGMTGYEANSVPNEYINAFLNAFRRLDQKVLMRFSKSRLASLDVPDNVRVVEWINQLDVLGHPKTRAFVSHCGMNGLMESVYHGVPILGVPIFGDQGDNSKFMHYRQLGIGLDKFGLTEEIVHESLMQLLYNETYRSNARRASDIWRMETETATERALHWIELTAQYGPLTHLQIIDSHLNWTQYWMLDVISVLIVAAALIVWMLVAMVTVSVRKCTRKTTANLKKKRQ